MADLFLTLLQPEQLVFLGNKYGSWRIVSEEGIRKLLPEQLSVLVSNTLSGRPP